MFISLRFFDAYSATRHNTYTIYILYMYIYVRCMRLGSTALGSSSAQCVAFACARLLSENGEANGER